MIFRAETEKINLNVEFFYYLCEFEPYRVAVFTNLSLMMLKQKAYFSSPTARLKSCVENYRTAACKEKNLRKKKNKLPKVSTNS